MSLLLLGAEGLLDLKSLQNSTALWALVPSGMSCADYGLRLRSMQQWGVCSWSGDTPRHNFTEVAVRGETQRHLVEDSVWRCVNALRPKYETPTWSAVTSTDDVLAWATTETEAELVAPATAYDRVASCATGEGDAEANTLLSQVTVLLCDGAVDPMWERLDAQIFHATKVQQFVSAANNHASGWNKCLVLVGPGVEIPWPTLQRLLLKDCVLPRRIVFFSRGATVMLGALYHLLGYRAMAPCLFDMEPLN